MTGLLVREYEDYATFVEDWPADQPEATMRSYWEFLGRLDEDEILVVLPEWLAEEKAGHVDGATPTAFVGRIGRETEKAIRLEDATEARPLARLAHRMARLSDGIPDAEDDPDRRRWLERRRSALRQEFEDRDRFVGLRDAWLPKSQLRHVVRRGSSPR